MPFRFGGTRICADWVCVREPVDIASRGCTDNKRVNMHTNIMLLLRVSRLPKCLRFRDVCWHPLSATFRFPEVLARRQTCTKNFPPIEHPIAYHELYVDKEIAIWADRLKLTIVLVHRVVNWNSRWYNVLFPPSAKISTICLLEMIHLKSINYVLAMYSLMARVRGQFDNKTQEVVCKGNSYFNGFHTIFQLLSRYLTRFW